MENNYDMVAIGDIVIDAFIRLKDAHVHCRIDTDACELCLRFGDKVPYEDVTVVPAVGNSPNAAVSASRMGLKTALVANIGDDKHGVDCLDQLKAENISTEHIIVEKNKITNYHYVLWYDVDRTILIKHTAFDYRLPALGKVSWIYLSSLADHSLPYHREIVEFLKNNPETKLAFQPGTFQIKLGKDALKDIYARTEIFFCNVEEAEKILEIETKDVKTLLQKMRELGPKIVVITDGLNGAYSYDGNEFLSMPIYPDQKLPYERTGAGDAFSSTVVGAIILGKTLPEALAWGSINGMSVVQEIGAQKGLLPRAKIEEYLKNAPAGYAAKKI